MIDCKVGDRIRLLYMPDDPDPIPAGATGTVLRVDGGALPQVHIAWGSGRTLALIPGVDTWETIERPTAGDDAGPVPVLAPVYRGIVAVRDSGIVNMLDRKTVAAIARKMAFSETAAWLDDKENWDTYVRGVLNGFKPSEW